MVEHQSAVVVAVDRAGRSAGAARFALAEARASGLDLRIVHVKGQLATTTNFERHGGADDADSLEAEARAVLDRAVERLSNPSDLAVEKVMLEGQRIPALVDATLSAEVLVLGRETRGGFDRLLLGGTTVAVATQSHCPVAVVGSHWEGGRERSRIVVGVDVDDTAPVLIEQAFALAVRDGAALTLIHATTGRRRESAERYLGALAGPHHVHYADVDYELVVVVDEPAAPALIHASDKADLMVLARHRRGVRHPRGLGSTARRVLVGSQVPVVLIPPDPAPRLAHDDVLVRGGSHGDE